MSSSPSLPNAQAATDAAGHAFDATQKLVSDHTQDPRLANEHGARAAAESFIKHIEKSATFNGALSYGIQALRVIFATITQAKKNNRADFADLSNEILSDLFQVPVTPTSAAPISDATTAQQFDSALGKPVMDLLESIILNGASPTQVDGEEGARTVLGFGMQFAVTSSFMAVLAEALSLGELKEWSAIGEDLIQSLGMGRLTRSAFRPLMRNAVTQPYDRKMRAKYRQDLIAAPEIVREWLAGRISEDDCNTWLSQHGYSDTFIAALKAQHTPSLNAAELEELAAIGAIDQTTRDGQMKEQGIPDSIAGWRLQVLTWKRLQGLRNRILSAVVSQMNQGFLQPSDLEKYISDLKMPDDEAALWRILAGVEGERTRKRISEGDMLFLYEAAQVTDADLQTFLESEGYSPNDVQLMLTFYRLKAAAATNSKTGGTAAKTAHAHIEHTAYVTDEISGIFSRKPTKAELDYWVTLLDLGERTKADFKTEIKGLDPTGSAIPS